MYLLELINYRIVSSHENALQTFDLAIAPGERCCIQTSSQRHAHVLLKALATLIPPAKGTYRFEGQAVKFGNYRRLLSIKRQIGYIGPDATLISNRSVLDNLLLMRYYFENRFNLTLDDKTEKLCRLFGLFDQLKMRPAELNPMDFNIAVAIRELSKSPKLLLLERPENFIGDNRLEVFITVLKDHLLQNVPIVFISYNHNFNTTLATNKILISKGKLTTVPVHKPSPKA
jgi:ABC-type iron transport system FetAB ATPase subunit